MFLGGAGQVITRSGYNFTAEQRNQTNQRHRPATAVKGEGNDGNGRSSRGKCESENGDALEQEKEISETSLDYRKGKERKRLEGEMYR